MDFKKLSYPHKYIINSGVNWVLSGHVQSPPDNWTKKDASGFVKWANKNCDTVSKKTTLFRGSRGPNPLTQNDCNPNYLFVSTSKSRDIASEFAGKNGDFLHVLHLKPGCKIIDMGQYYKTFHNPNVGREQEVIIIPGHSFEYLKRKDNIFEWEVRFEK